MARGSALRRRQGLGHGARPGLTPRPAASSTAPTPTASATAPSSAGTTSAGRSARATTSSKSRSSTASTTRPPREVMGLREGLVTVLIHSGSRGLGYQVCDDFLGVFKGAAEAVRLHPARPAARLRPGPEPRGAVVPRRDAGRGQLRLVQPAAADPPGPRGLRPGLREALEDARARPGLRRRAQHRQVRGPRRRRRRLEAGLRPPQGGDPGLPAGPPGDPAGLPGDRPAGDHPRQHGDGELGPRRPAGEHDAVVRHDLPRRGPDDEPDGRGEARRRPSDRQGARRPRHHRPRPGLKGLAEEQPAAYKDVDQVVEVVDKAGISRKVARLRPVGVIKG